MLTIALDLNMSFLKNKIILSHNKIFEKSLIICFHKILNIVNIRDVSIN